MSVIIIVIIAVDRLDSKGNIKLMKRTEKDAQLNHLFWNSISNL